MSTTLVLDRAGRVVIPKALREELRLGPGDTLELETVGEQIRLQPVREAVPIRQEGGVWVFRSSETAKGKRKVDVSIRQLIEAGREERRERWIRKGRRAK